MIEKKQSLKQLVMFFGLSSFLTFDTVYADNNIKNNNIGTKSVWTKLWGSAAPEPRLTLGMWSRHTTKKKRNGRNELIGISYRGFTVGTFVNSYYRRAYAVGIERYWLTIPLGYNFNYQLGYRLGLVSGYQGHDLIGIPSLKNAPFIPYVQLVMGLNWKHFGWEVSSPNPYVISTSFYIRFN